MRVTSAVVLFSLLFVTAEPVLAVSHHRFGKNKGGKTTKAVKTTTKLKTTSMVIPPTATPSVMVPPVGGIVPPVLVEVPTTSTKASVTPKVTSTPPSTEDPPQNDGNTNSGNNSEGNGRNKGGNNNARVLLEENVQDASSKTGQENTQVSGQADSLKDSANFINFCTGKQLTNGAQGRTPGSGPFCNGIPMGEIPDRTNMVSSIITFPTFGTTLQVGQAFDITVRVRGLAAGTFTNPDLTYYAAPQQLNKRGQILGHSHVTVQLLDAVDTQNIPDPDKFEFFKGINDAGDGQGTLKASVSNGLPVAGTYRVCTMTSAGNHQPVLMPVAQRGAQDDCVRFTVGAANNDGNSGGNNGGNKGGKTGGNTGGRHGRNRNPRSSYL